MFTWTNGLGSSIVATHTRDMLPQHGFSGDRSRSSSNPTTNAIQLSDGAWTDGPWTASDGAWSASVTDGAWKASVTDGLGGGACVTDGAWTASVTDVAWSASVIDGAWAASVTDGAWTARVTGARVTQPCASCLNAASSQTVTCGHRDACWYCVMLGHRGAGLKTLNAATTMEQMLTHNHLRAVFFGCRHGFGTVSGGIQTLDDVLQALFIALPLR